MIEFEHEHAVLHLDEGSGVAVVELGVCRFECGQQLVLIVFVEVLGKDEGGALGIVHREHALHLLRRNGGEFFGNEQPAVLREPLYDGLGARDALAAPCADKIHCRLLQGQSAL